MPARVVLAMPESATVSLVADAIRAKGHSVQTYTDPIEALSAMDRARTVKLLITAVRFAPERPNGLSLALMAQMRLPSVELVFVCHPVDASHVETFGQCVPDAIEPSALAALADSILAKLPRN